MLKKLKILLPIVLLVIFAALQFIGPMPLIDNLVHDNIMASDRAPAPNIVIVGIDQRSINEVGMWPWTRDIMAEVITNLSDMGAAAIGINVLYSTYGVNPLYDDMLVAAAYAAGGRVVLGSQGMLSSVQPGGLLSVEQMEMPFDALAAATTSGFMNMMEDGDGVMRRALTVMRYGDISVHSLPFEVYRTFRASQGQTTPMAADIIPLDEHGQFPVDFVGGPGTFQRRSLWGVLEGEYPAVFFENNIILIGPVAAGIGDGNFPTSAHRGTATFGIEIYANIIQNLFEGDFKQAAPWWLNTLVLAVVGIIIILLMQKLKPVPALVATLVLSAALIGAARLMYDMGGNILLVGAGIVFLLLCYLTSLVLDILSAQNDKQHIQGLFGRFVSPEVVKQIVESGEELKLGGSVRDITVVFVDIRGFTAFSEVNEPEVVVAMVNRYLDLTSRSIQENGGTIDKYIGDATMAIFNAPNDLPNHAMQAIKAAWAMKEGAVPLREEILRDYGVDLQFGVGVNTGPAVIGNMGSEFRMDYTAIGDTVNTAARLESNSQKGQIIISDSTYQLVKDNITATDMGLLNVKNKAVGIQIYELQGVK